MRCARLHSHELTTRTTRLLVDQQNVRAVQRDAKHLVRQWLDKLKRGDGISDLFHAGEVFLQQRLAVLDLRGQPTRRHSIPAFGLGQPAGRCDDQGTLPAGIRLLPPAR